MPLTLADLSHIMSAPVQAPDGGAAIRAGISAIGGAARSIAQGRAARRKNESANRGMDIQEARLAESQRSAMAREGGDEAQRIETQRHHEAAEQQDTLRLKHDSRKLIGQVFEDVSGDLNSGVPELQAQAIMRLNLLPGITVGTVEEAQEAIKGVGETLAQSDPTDPDVESGRTPDSIPTRAGVTPAEEADRLAESARREDAEREALYPEDTSFEPQPPQPPQLPPAMPGAMPGAMPAGLPPALAGVPDGQAVMDAQVQAPGALAAPQPAQAPIAGGGDSGFQPADVQQTPAAGMAPQDARTMDEYLATEEEPLPEGLTREQELQFRRDEGEPTEGVFAPALPALTPGDVSAPGMNLMLDGQSMGQLPVANMKDRLAEWARGVTESSSYEQLEAAQQMVQMAQLASPIVGAEAAMDDARDFYKHRSGEEGKDRRAELMSGQKMEGDELLRSGRRQGLIKTGYDMATGALKTKGFFKSRGDIAAMKIGLEGILHGNAAEANSALMKMIEAQQTGIVTDKDYTNAMGDRSVYDTIKGWWVSGVHGDWDDVRRKRIATALSNLMGARQGELKRTHRSMVITRDNNKAFGSEYTRDGFGAKMDEEFGEFEWYEQDKARAMAEAEGTGYSIDRDPTPGGEADMARTPAQRVEHSIIENRRIPGHAKKRANALLEAL